MELIKVKKHDLQVGIYLGRTSFSYCIVEKQKQKNNIKQEGIETFTREKFFPVISEFFQEKIMTRAKYKNINIIYSMASPRIIQLHEDRKKFQDINDELTIEKNAIGFCGIRKKWFDQLRSITNSSHQIHATLECLSLTLLSFSKQNELWGMDVDRNNKITFFIFVEHGSVFFIFSCKENVSIEYFLPLNQFEIEILKFKKILPDDCFKTIYILSSQEQEVWIIRLLKKYFFDKKFYLYNNHSDLDDARSIVAKNIAIGASYESF